jgi:hypothetical protein
MKNDPWDLENYDKDNTYIPHLNLVDPQTKAKLKPPPYPFCKHPAKCQDGRCNAEFCCND